LDANWETEALAAAIRLDVGSLSEAMVPVTQLVKCVEGLVFCILTYFQCDKNYWRL
jgi:hypothetical protein